MTPTVHVTGVDGLRVLPPSHPDFDALATPLLGRVAQTVLELKPMLILVSNDTQDTIVSFSMTWRVTHRSGKTSTFRSHTSFPNAVCGDGPRHRNDEPLTPGATRVEANGVVVHGWGDLDPYYDQFLPQFVTEKQQLLSWAVTLDIDVSCAIFADGTLIGTDDESWLEELFSTCVQAKQMCYRDIVTDLDAGKSVEEAFDRVARERSSPRSGHRSFSEAVADSSKTQAAADAAGWRRRHRDEDIPRLLKETIRFEPFVIRRFPRTSTLR